MNNGRSRARNREETAERLIQASIEILRTRGFEHLGVNAIAEAAGVSKVLIYRYFGDYNGLLRAVAERITPLKTDFAETIIETIPGDDGSEQPASAGQFMRAVILGLHDTVAGDELLQQILVWEQSTENELTSAMARQREEVGLEQTEKLRAYLRERGLTEHLDVNALTALVTAGVFYLTLRSRQVDVFNGVEITSEEGWERIASALTPLLDRKP